MHSKTTRIGVTLPDLLVVVAIIGLLVAMFLPAIQSSRAAARKIKCVKIAC
jgi:type II secretory pathway pseudopilin PulG